MYANFSGILTPSPCLQFGQIYGTKITQPPLLFLLLGQPHPPLSADVLYEWPLRIFHKGSQHNFWSTFHATYQQGSSQSHLRRVLALGVVDGHVLHAALYFNLKFTPHLQAMEKAFSVT